MAAAACLEQARAGGKTDTNSKVTTAGGTTVLYVTCSAT